MEGNDYLLGSGNHFAWQRPAGRVELLITDDMAKAPSLIKSPPCSAPPTEVPMRPEPTNAPAALSRRFSVAPMMDWTANSP